MNQFVLHNKNNSDLSIFENNNFYNIAFRAVRILNASLLPTNF